MDAIYRFVNVRLVYHFLFWCMMFYTMLYANGKEIHDWQFTFSNELVGLLFYLIVVYLNLLYLIPRYLSKNILLYLLLAIISCLLITPIEVFVLYVKLSGKPIYQNRLIEQQLDFYFSNMLVLGLSTFLRFTMDWWRHQNERQLLTAQRAQSELQFLKGQINPHFLFNTLNNLYALTLKKSDDAPAIVLKLSEIMRYMLYECNERRVSIIKEIQYINNYLDLERLRQPPDTTIGFTTTGELNHVEIAPLLFVPFLENSFKHGLNNAAGGGFVQVALDVSGNILLFTVKNNKQDMNIKPTGMSGGIGLPNVRQRLELLYPGNHLLTLRETSNSFEVSLQLTIG